MDYYSRSDIKKLPKIIQIKFHTFKCNINQNNKTIQIFFNFSKIKEKVLFEFLKQVKNMYTFIQKYIYINNKMFKRIQTISKHYKSIANEFSFKSIKLFI